MHGAGALPAHCSFAPLFTESIARTPRERLIATRSQPAELSGGLPAPSRHTDAMGGGPDLDKWIEKVKRCEYLAEDELKTLCEYVSPPQSHAACQGAKTRRAAVRVAVGGRCSAAGCARRAPLPRRLLPWGAAAHGVPPAPRVLGPRPAARRSRRSWWRSPTCSRCRHPSRCARRGRSQPSSSARGGGPQRRFGQPADAAERARGAPRPWKRAVPQHPDSRCGRALVCGIGP